MYVYTFKTRYLAYTLFKELKTKIEEKFPDDPLFMFNVEGSKGNAYIGTVDRPIEVWLKGDSFTVPVQGYVNKFMEEIKDEN